MVPVLVMVLLVSMPSVQAAPPTRTVFEAEGFELRAGQGCSFKVAIAPADDAPLLTETVFSDGDAMVQIRDGFIRLTNVKTGESIVHHSQYRTMWTFDALTDQIYAEDDGTAMWWFFPGDVGPYGVVGKPGLFLSLTGQVDTTWDPNTGLITSFDLDGRINSDLCALLSS
jgi:hypothetical protein